MPTLVHFSSDPAVHAGAQALFDRLAPELRLLLPEAHIEHIGATAVPGCITKGDLDIAVRVPAHLFTHADHALAARFPRNRGSTTTPTFSAFEDPTTTPPLGIQLCVLNSPDDMFSTFRDRLLANPTLIAHYNALKTAFEGKDMDAYRQAKSAWIESLLP